MTRRRNNPLHPEVVDVLRRAKAEIESVAALGVCACDTSEPCEGHRREDLVGDIGALLDAAKELRW